MGQDMVFSIYFENYDMHTFSDFPVGSRFQEAVTVSRGDLHSLAGDL